MQPKLAAGEATAAGDAIGLAAGLAIGEAAAAGEAAGLAAGDAAVCTAGEGDATADAAVGEAAGVAIVPTGATVGAAVDPPPQAVSRRSGATRVTHPCNATRREIRVG